MGRYDGRVAVITGAARGIGFGIATRLAEEGASIAVVDLDEAAAAPSSTAPEARRARQTSASRVIASSS